MTPFIVLDIELPLLISECHLPLKRLNLVVIIEFSFQDS